MMESSMLFQSKPEKTARNKVSFHWLISYLEIPVYRLVKRTCVPLPIQRQRFPVRQDRSVMYALQIIV